MSKLHLLYPNADDYKWKGDPNLSITGSGFSVPRGAESMFGYNGVVFNDTTVFDKYRVLSIDGLGDADIRDSREDKPGDDGEDAYDSYYSGRTIVIRLRIEAFQLDKLRDMEEALRTAFAVMEEKPLTFLTQDIEKDHYIMCKKSASLTKEESFQTFGTRFFREWQITLRASDPRFYRSIGKSITETSVAQDIDTINAINIGNYISYPTIYLTGEMGNINLENQDVAEPFSNLKFKSGVAIADGDFYKIDTLKRTVVNKNGQNKIADLDPSSGWLRLNPGNNRITLSNTTTIGASNQAQVKIEWKDAWI
jgi:phage-related protein